MARKFLIGGLFLIVMASACTVEVTPYDPYGTDFSMSGNWTVNGATPDATNCANAGIDTVQVVLFDGSSPFIVSDLTFSCSAGSFTTGNIFAYGSYTTQWQAKDATGAVIAQGEKLALVVSAPTDHANLAPVDFIVTSTPTFNPLGTAASMAVDWTINGVGADADSCAAAGFSMVRVMFYDATDTGYTNGVQVSSTACSAGKYDSRDSDGNILAEGMYITSVQALDSSGTVLDTFDSAFDLEVDVSLNSHYNLMTGAFTVPNTLVVNMLWDDGDCASAGVANVLWALNDVGNSVNNYITSTETTCPDQLQFDDIPAGTYSLWVDAENSDGSVKWMDTCVGLIVDDGNIEVYNCAYDAL